MRTRPLRKTFTPQVVGFLLITFLPVPIAAQTKKAPEVVTVGITDYAKVEGSYDRYEGLFKTLTQTANRDRPVTFKFAIGGYKEVLDWFNNGTIDVAILSAMPVAQLLSSAGLKELAKIKRAYIGDVSVAGKYSKSARIQSVQELFENGHPPDPFHYTAGCITLKSDTELQTIDDLKRLWQQRKVEFLFVRPYSMSGYVAPLAALRKHGIDPRPGEWKFTYEHQNSLEELRKEFEEQNGAPVKHKVAFVLDATIYTPAKKDPGQIFKRVKISELDNSKIPREIVLANYHLESETLDSAEGFENKFEKAKAIMAELFRNRRDGKLIQPTSAAPSNANGPGTLISWRTRSDSWTEDFSDSQAAIAQVKLPKELLYRTTLDELFKDLAAAASANLSPRLALVLSGGGAKCAYQAGAIIQIEKKLQEINRKQKEKSKPTIDINLVVGTSGGAINALLVATGVTSDDNAESELLKMWGGFRQQEFIRPSRRFNLIFGLCFGLLQALLIAVAVFLFGRQTMNWGMTFLVLILVAIGEVAAARYFHRSWQSILWLLLIQLIFVLFIIATVFLVDYLVDVARKMLKARAKSSASPAIDHESLAKEDDLRRWRRLTIVLMLAVSLLELFIAKSTGLEDRISRLSDSHWIEHGWMLLVLVCNFAFPYPLLIGILMALIGTVLWRSFDWGQRREPLVWLMTSILLATGALLLLDALFRGGSLSKFEGIEEAFVEKVPALIRNTIRPDFPSSQSGATSGRLEDVSRQIMRENSPLMQRDLIITTSRLPILETAIDAEVINGLPDDLYFYFRANHDEKLAPPLDSRFVPFKYNPEKVLDVVIGSSTIYPIFPSRKLSNVRFGTDEAMSKETAKELRIVDGGFIHNIPLQAATLWKASHIISIEASPIPRQVQPEHFWDNAMTAFNYLFTQAQRTDQLSRGGAETFELRPTSLCDKGGRLPPCETKDDIPNPNMDTFDFSPDLVKEAFEAGMGDVTSKTPLFIRIPGPPMFRSVTDAMPSQVVIKRQVDSRKTRRLHSGSN